MSWYKAGTVSVTNGNAVVTGTGTAFVANVKVGDAFVGPDDRSYEIVTVNSNTSLTISPAYLGSNQSGQSYRIQPTNGITVDLTAAVRDLITNYSGVLTGAGAGQFADGTVSVPGIRFTSDQDTGFRRISANRMAVVTAGVDRMTWEADGRTIVVGAYEFDASGNFLPVTHNVRDIGTAARRIRNIWVNGVAVNHSDSPKAHVDINGQAFLRLNSRLVFGDFVSFSDHGPWIAHSTAANTLDIVSGFNPTSNGMGAGGIRFGMGSGSTWSGRLNMTNSTFEPNNNNFMDLGAGAVRYKDLYLVNAPNVSSDERLKNWQRSTLTEGEIAAGERILGELGYFQWLDMIAEKGVENARWHFGALAQEVVRIFIDEGVETIDPALLDIEPDVFVAEEDRPSMRQAFLTFDTWEAAYEDDVLVRPAGNVFGFRPEQLTLFLLRVSHELRLRDKSAAELRMDALEQRIEALEGV